MSFMTAPTHFGEVSINFVIAMLFIIISFESPEYSEFISKKESFFR